MSTAAEAKKNAEKAIVGLLRYRAGWFTFGDFERHLDNMKTHFSAYNELWLMGHFSNSFARKIQGFCTEYPGCDFRVLSLPPGGNQRNRDALEKMKGDGAKIKIHSKLHGRMFIGCNEDTDTMTMIVGTYDYTRDGMSGENVNVGLRTNSPEAIKKAKDFFMEQWNSTDAEEIV